ncbi:hypothetical protein ADUPG1_006047 [Aduncisulcus paluster]|uniref:Uncharacterized protein n=1 Tax=Aduncisulcus paluster TaxID=2918883 RepID=A0ABQ5KK24_9EUKA|nr:hypothetical protein ADUPG1_006047 [Aduncisulcus paluster]
MEFVPSYVLADTEVHVVGLPIAPLDDLSTSDAFLHIAIDSSVPTSFLTAHNDSGFISSILITEDEISPDFAIQLTVGSLGTLMFPNLDDFFSPSRNLFLSFSVPEDEEATDLYAGFNSDGMSFSLTFDMRIDVAQSGTYDTSAEEIAVVRFDISGSGEMTATDTPSLDGIIIAGNIASIDVTNPSIEFLKDDLDVSTYFFDDFASILNPLLESVLIPIINKTLESGMEIQLPEGMTADGVAIYYFEEMCYITCDILE